MRGTIRLAWAGLLAASLGACSLEDSTTGRQDPNYRPPTAAEQACANQGLMRGTEAYDRCLARENGTTATPAPAAPTPPAGVEAFRDEFGHRYDGQGNRLDDRGNII